MDSDSEKSAFALTSAFGDGQVDVGDGAKSDPPRPYAVDQNI